MEATQLLVRIILTISAMGILVLFISGAYYSAKENEQRALFLYLAVALIIPAVLVLLIMSGENLKSTRLITAGVSVLISLATLLPLKGRKYKIAAPARCADERDIMFSRASLQPGTILFDEYYQVHPEFLERDNKFRAKPGMLSPDSSFYNLFAYASANASFETVRQLSELREGTTTTGSSQIEPDKLSMFIKEWGKKLGAVSIGITEMKDYHFYTYEGRGSKYGEEVKNNHSYGLVFTVEMDHELISSSPKAAAVMESAHQYANSGMIATQIALTLRNIGYEATTHIAGNYDLICPLVAKDAGLGEIGRMGLLMTPELGPRVRISVVTTDAPLTADRPMHNNAVLDFCTRCKKCARNCPSSSIPFTDRMDSPAGLKWQIDQSSCFTYWCQVGTDCGRCMSVCPYSHPDNKFHNIIRMGISRNFIFRKAALVMDNLFYGSRPKLKKNPQWMG